MSPVRAQALHRLRPSKTQCSQHWRCHPEHLQSHCACAALLAFAAAGVLRLIGEAQLCPCSWLRRWQSQLHPERLLSVLLRHSIHFQPSALAAGALWPCRAWELCVALPDMHLVTVLAQSLPPLVQPTFLVPVAALVTCDSSPNSSARCGCCCCWWWWWCCCCS